MTNEWKNIFVYSIKNMMSRFNSIQYYQTEIYEVFSACFSF